MKSHGFTLIETLVAVTILTLAVVGPLLAASRGLVAATTAKDQLTASFLAQEGIEYVRLIRDDQYLANNGNQSAAWAGFQGTSGYFSTCVVNTSGSRSGRFCQPDALAATIQTCQCRTGISTTCAPATSSNSTCTTLNVDPVAGYSQSTPSNPADQTSSFMRTVQIKQQSDTATDEVDSYVTWVTHGLPFSIEVTDYLTQWQ
jgi:prepilin-type N-terminal cleavage/methylation domain-containing protein